MFAYCDNNPVLYMDHHGSFPSSIFATCFNYDGYARTYSDGQAITLTRTNNTVYIQAYMTFHGNVDSGMLIQGIKQYWEGTYSYGNDTINVSVCIYPGKSSGGNTIQVYSSDSYGRSYCNVYPAKWRRTKESSITLFADYYTSVGCDWTIAHEFGHSMGVYDYYKYDYLPGYDPSFPSIMLLPGAHASNADIQKVMFAFISNSCQPWYCEGGF